MAVVDDRGFFITWQAIRRQLAAMPNDLYLIRLIHRQTRRPFPGERLWTAVQLLSAATIRFLRARNREGCDVYLLPFAGDGNAGYILIDLDRADWTVVDRMRAHGHAPCVVLETSPGHLQAWVRVSLSPLEPAVATAVSKQLAHTYSGDLASTDWRHLGRLAGFTNQKPQRLTLGGYAPWVKVVHTQAGLAPQADALLQSVFALAPIAPPVQGNKPPAEPSVSLSVLPQSAPTRIAAAEAQKIYCGCVQRWHIHQRFPQPDWSIVDLWVARHLLLQGTPPAQVQEILRLASPYFPRRHGNPDDYLRRTVARAISPRPRPPVCAHHAGTSPSPAPVDIRSNSAGGR
jgi:hypothetical protein